MSAQLLRSLRSPGPSRKKQVPMHPAQSSLSTPSPPPQQPRYPPSIPCMPQRLSAARTGPRRARDQDAAAPHAYPVQGRAISQNWILALGSSSSTGLQTPEMPLQQLQPRTALSLSGDLSRPPRLERPPLWDPPQPRTQDYTATLGVPRGTRATSCPPQPHRSPPRPGFPRSPGLAAGTLPG